MTATTAARPADRSPFGVFRAAVEHLSLRRVRVGRLCLLRLEGIPVVPRAMLRGPGNVRQGLVGDLDRLALLGEGSREDFARRLAGGDRFAVAVLEDRIIGYEWFSTKACQMAEPFHYQIEIPPDSIYAFNAFIHPQYRLGGVWLKLKAYLAGLMQEVKRNRVLTYVEAGNRLSLNSHLRFGFKAYKKVFVIHVRDAFSISI